MNRKSFSILLQAKARKREKIIKKGTNDDTKQKLLTWKWGDAIQFRFVEQW
jgi:hypothetical protein